ncbi:hypothetical protein HELRODRAFT_169513 [Helobdella robusta]|uniref:Uncharacterized protein n=1 Tax=Helobdella robusta TaxID=6412 RepID=T1F214_HELRO|nr:hypothetical protein HELRODRAFT_169513 [Helobdella robusta]ESO08634.1 hypothetical protein HELRODRAFT_169513 [Helobdella robusta]
MSHIMKNDVAFGFNMVGKKGKMPFGSSKLFEIVYRLVKKCFNWRGHEKKCGVSSGKMVDCPCKALFTFSYFPTWVPRELGGHFVTGPTWAAHMRPICQPTCDLYRSHFLLFTGESCDKNEM